MQDKCKLIAKWLDELDSDRFHDWRQALRRLEQYGLSIDEVRRLAEHKRSKFQKLYETWKRATRLKSFTEDIVIDESYQRIIGLGEPAIPLILEKLQERPDHLFWALRAITGHELVPDDELGDMRKMTDKWLEWGIAMGYIEG
jgi:DNA-binding transcriptional MerR regulator